MFQCPADVLESRLVFTKKAKRQGAQDCTQIHKKGLAKCNYHIEAFIFFV